MELGHAVKILRAVENISQAELAARMGVDPSFVSLLETGARQFTDRTLVLAMRAFTQPR